MSERKVIIADPNRHFRTGFGKVLRNIGNVRIVGEASSCEELKFLIEETNADLVFLNLFQQDESKSRSACKMYRKYHGTEFIVISEHDSNQYIKLVKDAGMNGFLSKNRNNIDQLRKILQKGSADFDISINKSAKQLKTNSQY